MGGTAKTVWVAVSIALGLLVAFAVHWFQTAPEAPDATSAESEMGEPARTVRSDPEPSDTIELSDVYTSEEAARQAYVAERQRRALSQRALEAEQAASGAAAAPLWALFEGAGAAADGSEAVSEGEPSDGEETDDVESATATAVAATVVSFLRDSVARRDLVGFTEMLDEGFRYTFDSGTPDDITDDRVYDRATYERVVVPRLFDPLAEAEVALSEPRAFAQLESDVAAIEVDYDIALRRQGPTDRFAGTASFLLLRDPTAPSPGEWRVLDWVDSPPSPVDR